MWNRRGEGKGGIFPQREAIYRTGRSVSSSTLKFLTYRRSGTCYSEGTLRRTWYRVVVARDSRVHLESPLITAIEIIQVYIRQTYATLCTKLEVLSCTSLGKNAILRKRYQIYPRGGYYFCYNAHLFSLVATLPFHWTILAHLEEDTSGVERPSIESVSNISNYRKF